MRRPSLEFWLFVWALRGLYLVTSEPSASPAVVVTWAVAGVALMTAQRHRLFEGEPNA